MNTRAFLCFLTAMLASVTIQAQLGQQTGDLEAPGTVIGHVYCADTHKPARFAKVMIESVADFSAVERDKEGNIAHQRVPRAALVLTGVDGSYSIENLPAGQYYIVAESPGYLLPLTEFTSEDTSFPSSLSKEDEKRFREGLQQVTVVSDQTSRMDIVLERGGAISGKVLYDDGGVVAGAPVSLLRKIKGGSWKPVSIEGYREAVTTDDQGHYRIAMLPAGEYLVAVYIGTMTMSMEGGKLPGLLVSQRTYGWTGIYSGDTGRRAEAKSIPLRDAEDRAGVDITVPLSKLHVISGTLVAKSDGHAINRGKIRLEDPLDGTTVKEAWLNPGTGEFSMDFVPEGQYTLKIYDAADGVMDTRQIKDGQIMPNPPSRAEHTYPDTEQPLKVIGDISGITITVADPDVGNNSVRPSSN